MKKILLIFFFAFISSLIFADNNVNITPPFQDSPIPLYRPIPLYPKEALQQQLSGKVIVGVLVNAKNGKVLKAKVLKSDNAIFNKSALEAAKKTLFKQYRIYHEFIHQNNSEPYPPFDKFQNFWFSLHFSFVCDHKVYSPYSPPILRNRGKYNLPEEYKTLEYILPIVVSVLVGEDGKPKEVKLRVGGIKNMHDYLLNAAMSSTFKPTQKDGKAVEAWYDIVFDFNK